MHIAASSELITEADDQGEIKQLEKAPTPVSSVPSGSEVASNAKVYLSCSAENATIYYTMDGTKPTKHSYKYSNYVPVGGRTITIKAIAIGGGYEESDVAVFEYIIPSENTSSGESGGGTGGSGGSGSEEENALTGGSGSGGEDTTTGTSGSENESDKTGSSSQSSGNNNSGSNKAPSKMKELAVGTKLTDTASCGIYKVTNGKKGTVKYVKPTKSKISKAVIPSTITRSGKTYQVTEVGAKAFYNCKKLKTVTLGKNVTTIRGNAFKKCKSLKTVIIKSKKLKTLEKSAFAGMSSKATIKVPSSKYKAYKKLFRKKGLKKTVKIKK